LAWIGGGASFGLVIASLASPYLVYERLRSATASRDLVQLGAIADFDSIREGLETQFASAMEQEMGDKMRDNPMAAQLQVVGQNIVVNLSKAFAQPKAIVAMSRGTVSPGGEDAREAGEPFEDAETSFGLTRDRKSVV
jgi:hypothetical protein